ncbi:vitrin isoform X2 [Narcine bancroftii]|uniref:vitrin isoform X2 n=1 Tax=Narcine bancroftii TaxID=1343680 RepID=UPI003831AEF9
MMCLSAAGAFTLVCLLTLADGLSGKERRSNRPSVPQIDCDVRAGKVKVSEFVARCPPGCLGTKQAVWGTDIYASVSSVCVAAIHSGVIRNRGGKIRVQKVPNSTSYKGTFSNGVRSLSLPRWRESFVVSAPRLQKGATYPSVLEFLPPRSSRIRTGRLKTTQAPVHTSTQPTTIITSTRQTVPTQTAPTTHLPLPRSAGGSAASRQPAIPWPALTGGREPAFRETGVSEFSTRNNPVPHAGFARQAQMSWPRSDWLIPPVKHQGDNAKLAIGPTYSWPQVKTHHNPAHSSRLGLSAYEKWVLGLSEGTHNHRIQDPGAWTLGSSDRGQRLGEPWSRPWESSQDALQVQNQNMDKTEINFWKSDFDSGGFRTRDEEPVSRGDPSCKVDLAFLVDGSWSIGRRRFGIQKKFLMSVAESLDVGMAGPLIGLVQFGSNASVEFNLQTHQTSRDLKRAIERIQQKGGLSNVGRALSHTIGSFFSSEQGNRGGAPNVVVVLVDGWPSDKVGDAARLARESGINIFFLTVEGADQSERQHLVERDFVDKSVCRTTGYFSIAVPSWFQLHHVVAPLVQRVCDTERLACSKTCLNSADLGFVVDGSSSVGTGNFGTVLDFVANVSRQFEISDTATRVGVVQYTYEQRLEFGFGVHNTREEVTHAIKSIRYWSGGTSTGAAITYASKHLFSKSKPNKRKLLIVITDGRSYDDVHTPALAAHRNGVIAYAVGIAWAAMDELEYIATDPDKDHSFFVEDFNSLHQFVPRIMHNICQEFNSQPRN